MVFAGIVWTICLRLIQSICDPYPNHVDESSKNMGGPVHHLSESVVFQSLNYWILWFASTADIEVTHNDTVIVLGQYFLQCIHQGSICFP